MIERHDVTFVWQQNGIRHIGRHFGMTADEVDAEAALLMDRVDEGTAVAVFTGEVGAVAEFTGEVDRDVIDAAMGDEDHGT